MGRIVSNLGCHHSYSWTSLCPKCCFIPGTATQTTVKNRLTGLSTVPTSHSYILFWEASLPYPTFGWIRLQTSLQMEITSSSLIFTHNPMKKNIQQESWKTLRMCCGNCCFYCLPTQGQGTNADSDLDFNSLSNEKNAFMNHKHHYSKISQQIQSPNQTSTVCGLLRASYYRHRSPLLLPIETQK